MTPPPPSRPPGEAALRAPRPARSIGAGMRRARRRLLPASFVLALACGGGVVLARDDAPEAAAPAAAAPTGPQPEDATCDILLMLSGREAGLLKPCGCSEPQMGGLERRATLWDRARANAKASAAVSLGDDVGEGQPRQDDIKAEVMRAAFSAMGYRGMVLAASDLVPGVPAATTPYGTPEETPRPPFNVKIRPGGMLAASAAVDPVLAFQVGDLPVRVVSVVDPTVRDGPGGLVGSGVAEAVVPPEAALRALPKAAGLLVVAAHTHREDIGMITAAAREKADFVVVVDMPGQVALSAPIKDRAFDKPLLVTFGEKGKEVGLLRLRRANPGFTVAYEAVPLDPRLDAFESPLRAEIAGLFTAYWNRVREEKLLEEFPRFADEPGAATWVGSAACKDCHPGIHAQWKQTPHSVAFSTLQSKGVADDPECVRCHTVGWTRLPSPQGGGWTRSHSSFWTAEKTPHLEDVGCESCHGPGSKHVKDPADRTLFGAWREKGKTMWRSPPREACAVCHDIENSVPFQKPGAYETDFRPVVDHHDVPEHERTVWTPPAGGETPGMK